MSKKELVTPKGAGKLLRTAFIENDDVVNTLNKFEYLALGNGLSGYSEYANTDYQLSSELTVNSYSRVLLEFPSNLNNQDNPQRIVMQGIVDEENVGEDTFTLINEIGVVDSSVAPSEVGTGELPDETFFCLIKVPEIEKTKEFALQYTIIVDIKIEEDE